MALAVSDAAMADSGDLEVGMNQDGMAIRADGHAPIGVMGEHMHKTGEWMVSYRYMRMFMEGSRDGTNELSPVEIATTVPNRFFGITGQPPTLRVVPTEMTMDMHMFGAMHAPTDWVTLMAMGMYVDKEMDHITFAGGAGTTELGTFTTATNGIGDSRVAALVRLLDDGGHHVHLNAGISIPTGSIDEEDDVLAPNGTRPTLRVPYPMQLGSGTFDALPGLTYTAVSGRLGWGAQYTSVIHIGENDENYTLGDEHRLTAWGSWQWRPWISISFRIAGQNIGSIDGIDPNIVVPVQTADPNNQGGDRIDTLFGINLAGQSKHGLAGHRLAAEFGMPIYQDLNGPQLETDWLLTLGYQYAF